MRMIGALLTFILFLPAYTSWWHHHHHRDQPTNSNDNSAAFSGFLGNHGGLVVVCVVEDTDLDTDKNVAEESMILIMVHVIQFATMEAHLTMIIQISRTINMIMDIVFVRRSLEELVVKQVRIFIDKTGTIHHFDLWS